MNKTQWLVWGFAMFWLAVACGMAMKGMGWL